MIFGLSHWVSFIVNWFMLSNNWLWRGQLCSILHVFSYRKKSDLLRTKQRNLPNMFEITSMISLIRRPEIISGFHSHFSNMLFLFHSEQTPDLRLNLCNQDSYSISNGKCSHFFSSSFVLIFCIENSEDSTMSE